jgi:hypothetical protein
MNLNFRRSDFTYGVENDHNVESGFYDFRCSFRRCDYLLFDVLIALINLFDVLIVYGVFGVLFGFQRCDFRSSDLFPNLL